MYMQLCLVGKLIIEKSLKTTENNDNQTDKKIAFITTGAIVYRKVHLEISNDKIISSCTRLLHSLLTRC